MTDEVFEDSEFITAADIQWFLEQTPYGHPSFLAAYEENGMSAEKIAQAAQMYRINPLVILVKLQVESSLIFKVERPGQFLLDRAMGCVAMTATLRAIGANPACSRKSIVARDCWSYIPTRHPWPDHQRLAGWRLSSPQMKRSSCRAIATAALYTYTPGCSSVRAETGSIGT